jgi:GNAT superfamily N-acetyltransferase
MNDHKHSRRLLSDSFNEVDTKPLDKNYPHSEEIPDYSGRNVSDRISKIQMVPIEHVVPTEIPNDRYSQNAHDKKVEVLINHLNNGGQLPAIMTEFAYNEKNPDLDALAVVDGHHRLSAAKKLGLTHVPVRIRVPAEDWDTVKQSGGFKLNFGKASQETPSLHKAPIEYSPEPNGISTHPIKNPNESWNQIHEQSLPNGLVYKQFKRDDAFQHHIVDPSSNKSLATVHTRAIGHPDYSAPQEHVVTWSQTDPSQKGKGLGRQAYLATLVHGKGVNQLNSGRELSLKGHQAWSTLKNTPGLKVNLAPYATDEAAQLNPEAYDRAAAQNHSMRVHDAQGLSHEHMFPKVDLGSKEEPMAASEKMEKGSFQRKHPFNPTAAQPQDSQRENLHQWQGGDYGDRRNRALVQKDTGTVRDRFLHRISGKTPTRRASDGGREFLLHRGYSQEREPIIENGSSVSHQTNSSWTPDYEIAKYFSSLAGKNDNRKISSAWIHEKNILTVPKQYGNIGRVPGEVGGSRNIYAKEHEVIVAPHTSEKANYTPANPNLPNEDLHVRISLRGSDKTNPLRYPNSPKNMLDYGRAKKTKLAASESMEKGSRQRKVPFNPQKDLLPKDQRIKIDDWQNNASREMREGISTATGNARVRFLHKLSAKTKVRHAKEGGREFLLHRGESGRARSLPPEPAGTSHETHAIFDQPSSWSPDYIVANRFAHSGGDVTTAWVHENDILTIPKQYGQSLERPHGRKNKFSDEYEVIVQPRAYEKVKHVPQDVTKPNPDIEARITQRGQRGYSHFQNPKSFLRERKEKLAASEKLTKAYDKPEPAKAGEVSPDGNFVSINHPKLGVVWDAHPTNKARLDARTLETARSWLQKQPQEHHPVLKDFINSVLKDPNRHLRYGSNQRGGGDAIRQRHIHQMISGNPDAKLTVHSPNSLTLTVQRHGINPKVSNFHFNREEKIVKSETLWYNDSYGHYVDYLGKGHKFFIGDGGLYSLLGQSDSLLKNGDGAVQLGGRLEKNISDRVCDLLESVRHSSLRRDAGSRGNEGSYGAPQSDWAPLLKADMNKPTKVAIKDLVRDTFGDAGAHQTFVFNKNPKISSNPVSVAHNVKTGKLHLVDGYHRVLAAEKRGETHISANVHKDAGKMEVSKEGYGTYRQKPLKKADMNTKKYSLKYHAPKGQGAYGLHTVTAHDHQGNVVGELSAEDLNDGTFQANMVEVHPEHRRKGIASAMYNHLQTKTGLKAVPDLEAQTPEGAAIWKQKNRPFGKSERLAKAPMIADQGSEFPEEALRTESFNPKEHKKIKTYKLKDGHYYHIFKEHGEDGHFHHSISKSPDLGQKPISIMRVSPYNHNGEDSPTAAITATDSLYQGKGFGTRLKGLAARYHGSLGSDSLVSESENKSWEKFKRNPNYKFYSGQTQYDLAGDDEIDRHIEGEAMNFPHTIFPKKGLRIKKSSQAFSSLQKASHSNKLLAALGLAATTALPMAQMAPQTITPKQAYSQYPSSKKDIDLRSIAQVESRGGKDTKHKTITSGMNAGSSAYGKFGLTHNTIKDVIKNSPTLHAHKNVLQMSPPQVNEYMSKHPSLEDKIASTHYDDLNRTFNGNLDHIAFAWLSGKQGAINAIKSGKSIDRHWHVSKINNAKRQILGIPK